MQQSSYRSKNEYGHDYVGWMRESRSINLLEKEERQAKIDNLYQQIINAKDDPSSFAYFFAKEYKQHVDEMQDIILKYENDKYVYLFAKDIDQARITDLENIIIKSNKIIYISKFACFVKGADSQKLQQIVANFNSAKSCYMLIKYSKQINTEYFKEIIFKSKKPRYVYELSKRLTDPADLEKAEELILKSNSFTYLRLFAKNINTANIGKFDRELIIRNDKDEMQKFAKAVKRSRLNRLLLFF